MRTMELARQMRSGEIEISPHKLWSAAQLDGASYPEAMIHAGAVGPKRQAGEAFMPYDVCPTCGEELGPMVWP